MQRPPRPFGVTLAIGASLILFTLFPLLEVGMLLLVRLHFSRVTFANDDIQPFAMGADMLGIPDSRLVVQVVVALVFLVIAIFAWRGRPPYMRFILMLSCALLTIYSIAAVVAGQILGNDAEGGISSLDSIVNSISLGQFTMGFLVTIYVIWYLSRGPARAFYRGYYLTSPDCSTSANITAETS